MLSSLQEVIKKISNIYNQPIIVDFVHRFAQKLQIHFTSNESSKLSYFIRGSIYFVELWQNIHSEQNKLRPCIIISNQRFNNGNTVVVLPITSSEKIKQGSLPINYSLQNWLKKGWYILIPQIRTISKSRIRWYIGTIEWHYFKSIDMLLQKILCTKNPHQ